MRKLTIRERVLLVILALMALVCGYVFLFHLPLEERTAALNARISESQSLLEQTQVTAARQQQMESALEQLYSADPAPKEMPDYDNIQAVMVELNRILADSREYSLRFTSAEGEDRVLERQVTLPFTCADYAAAKGILQELHDSPLRCQLEDVSISQGEDGAVQVTVSLVFFEYQAD